MKQNILLTGVSSGLGLAICRSLLQEGHQVFGISRSFSPALEKLQQAYPALLHWQSLDLAETALIHAQQLSALIPKGTPIHAFINNAALAYDDLITNLQLDPLQQLFAVNVLSPMMLSKLCIRNMLLHRTAGNLIHLSSISAHTGYKGLAMYAATKGALEAFSKNTAREWGSKGIRSNCIVAGFMETDMTASLSQEQKDRIYKRTSLKKATTIDSVVSTIRFLLSEGAGSITGQNLFVDSGTI
ncbi:MAG: SDR family oxidoreductase [Saprospiraceae bacterium]|nr:SDR family oxidoreductase [Saprospiraceae bacterium]